MANTVKFGVDSNRTKIFGSYVESLVGAAYNQEWIDAWSYDVIACQLWSEDWVIGCVENGSVVCAALWTGIGDSIKVVIGNQPTGTEIKLPSNWKYRDELFTIIANRVYTLRP